MKKVTYEVYTRTLGMFLIETFKEPVIFKDLNTGYRMLQFEEGAWFRLADVVCFFRRNS